MQLLRIGHRLIPEVRTREMMSSSDLHLPMYATSSLSCPEDVRAFCQQRSSLPCCGNKWGCSKQARSCIAEHGRATTYREAQCKYESKTLSITPTSCSPSHTKRYDPAPACNTLYNLLSMSLADTSLLLLCVLPEGAS